MKKLLLPLFLMSLALVSCRDDDGDDGRTRTGTFENRITGTWELTDVDYSGYMPNPINPGQGVNFSGEGEDVYGEFNFKADLTATYYMGFTARLDIGTNEPVRLPFYRPGSGTWWTKGSDSIFVAESIDTIGYEVIEDWDDLQRWKTVLPILDSVSGTFVDVDMQVILRK